MAVDDVTQSAGTPFLQNAQPARAAVHGQTQKTDDRWMRQRREHLNLKIEEGGKHKQHTHKTKWKRGLRVSVRDAEYIAAAMYVAWLGV